MNETSKPSQISRLIIALRELKSAINYRDACVVGGFSPMRITDDSTVSPSVNRR